MIGSALSLDLLLVAKYWLFALADKPVVWSRPMPCSLSEYPPPFTTRWKNAMNTRYGATSWSFSPLAEISPVAALAVGSWGSIGAVEPVVGKHACYVRRDLGRWWRDDVDRRPVVRQPEAD